MVLRGAAKNAERVEDEPRGWRQGLERSPSQFQPSLGGRNLLTAVPRGPKHHPVGCKPAEDIEGRTGGASVMLCAAAEAGVRV